MNSFTCFLDESWLSFSSLQAITQRFVAFTCRSVFHFWRWPHQSSQTLGSYLILFLNMLYIVFCILQNILDSRVLSPHILNLCRKQFSFKNNITLSTRIYNHVTITEWNPRNYIWKRLTFMHRSLYVQYIQNGNAHGDMFIFIQQSCSDIFHHASPPYPPNQIWAAHVSFCLSVVCESHLFKFLRMFLFLWCFKWTCTFLKDKNHSRSEPWVGFFRFVTLLLKLHIVD